MKKILLFILTLSFYSVSGQTYTSTTFVGSGTSGITNGTGTAASFMSLRGSTIDNDGNIYVCDFFGNKIRKITPAGVTSDFAGTISPGFADGAATTAQFNGPNDICFDKTNNVFYVADTGNNRIRKITLAGVVSTVAGSSTSGLVNGIGGAARFNAPHGVDVDIAGNLVVADRDNHAIRKIIVATGEVTTLAGNGLSGNTNGSGSTARFNGPTDIVINPNGFAYIADNGNHKIRYIDYQGFTYDLAGTGTQGDTDGTSLSTASFSFPFALAFMNSYLLIAESGNDRIRQLNFSKYTVETISGSTSGNANGVGAATQYNNPLGLVTDGYNIYVSDNNNYVMKKVTITDSCTGATVLSANSGTVTMGTINGNWPIGTYCFSGAGSSNTPNPNINANWWAFTPAQNGLLNISSATPNNAPTIDTRLAILSGTCGNYSCYSFNDNISTTDLRSSLTEILLNAGTTYYFVWDDKTTDTGAVDFTYTFTPQTCFRPRTAYIYDAPTNNSVHIGWTAPTIGDTSIDSYTLEVGPSGFTPGTGTALFTAITSDTNHIFTGLSTGILYTVWIKSTCAPSDISSWRGISTFTQFSATNTNYSENFDASTNYLNQGWNINPGVTNATTWATNTSSSFSQSGNNSIRSFVEYNTPSNAYIYSRRLNLVTGQNYRVTYYARKNANYIDAKYKVLLVSNSTYYLPTNHTILHDDQNFINTTYVVRNHDFTVNTNAAYRIGFKNESSKNIYYTLSGGLYIDTFSVSTVLSTQNFEKSGLSVYPNPVLDFVTIQNDNNIDIEKVLVIDLNGRVVKEINYGALQNGLLDIASLEKGIYVLNLTTSNNEVLSKKIIKE
jgi:sugar lactone lactonase YvrE